MHDIIHFFAYEKTLDNLLACDFVVDGIDELAVDEILVYPNPANDYIYVKNKRIDVSNLPSGIYLIRIDNRYVKVVVEH